MTVTVSGGTRVTASGGGAGITVSGGARLTGAPLDADERQGIAAGQQPSSSNRFVTLSELNAATVGEGRFPRIADSGLSLAPGTVAGVVATAKDNTSLAYLAVDGDSGTSYGDNTGQTVGDWMSFDLGERRAVSQVVVQQSHATDYAPGWDLLGSHTGAFVGEETTVDSGSLAAAGTYTHTISPAAEYRYWRIELTSVRGGFWWQVNEVAFTAAEELVVANLAYGQRVISYDSGDMELDNERITALADTSVVLLTSGIDYIEVYDADGSTLRATATVAGYTAGGVHVYFD